MTALTLLNRHLNNNFAQPFVSPLWVRESEASETNHYGFYSQMKYDQDNSAWKVTLEAAGVTKENLKVDMKEGYLTVAGEKTKGLELGKFEKHFKIPEGVDLEKIEAHFEDGVLSVQLPLEAKKAPKSIQIK